MSAPGVFSTWQPRYAAHGIATFPVTIAGKTKKPAVRGYLKIGFETSRALAEQFTSSDALGFALGPKSGITILDVDTPNEVAVSEAMAQHGRTPLVVRTGSGNFQCWYRHNGERRLIRPWDGKPIDILGGGYTVAPPSKGTKRNYEIIQGRLDDLPNLPKLSGLFDRLPQAERVCDPGTNQDTARNTGLWRFCMAQARHCDRFDDLLDVARTRNDEFMDPLQDEEVLKVAKSSWGYEERGENWFGRPGAFFPADEANHLITTDQDALILLTFLRANNRPTSIFWLANGTSKILGWTTKRLAAARRRLVGKYIEMIRQPKRGKCPALYRWIP